MTEELAIIRLSIVAKASETTIISEKIDLIPGIEVVPPTTEMDVDIVIVSQAGYKQNVNALKAIKRNQGCAIVGIYSAKSPKTFYEKISADLVDETISSAALFTDELRIILADAYTLSERSKAKEKQGNQTTGRQNRLVAITGATATGKTSLAVNLAIALSKMKYKVMLIDANLQADDIDIYMDIQRKSRTMYDIIISDTINDYGQHVVPSIVKYKDIDLLLSPTEFTDADQIEPVAFSEILGVVKPEYDFIIVDTSTHVDDISDAIFAAATDVFLLSNQTIQSAYYGRKLLLFIRECQFQGEPLLLVPDTDITTLIEPDEVEKIVGLKNYMPIPYDHRRLIEAANEGSPIILRDRSCPYTKMIRKLASRLAASEPAVRQYNMDYMESAISGQQQEPQNKSILGKLVGNKDKASKKKNKKTAPIDPGYEENYENPNSGKGKSILQKLKPQKRG